MRSFKIVVVLFYLFFCHCSRLTAQLHFIENKGQWPEHALFGTDLPNSHLYITSNEFLWQLYQLPEHRPHAINAAETIPADTLYGHNYSMTFIGARFSDFTPLLPDLTAYNYFTGSHFKKWVSGAKSYRLLEFRNIYPGISMKVNTAKNNIKYDLILQPGADLTQIQIQYKGISHLKINDTKLQITTSLALISEFIPESYQIINGQKHLIKCHYKALNDSTIGFSAVYNPAYALIIDPGIIVASYGGSNAVSVCVGANSDESGNLYNLCNSYSGGYPVTLGAFQQLFKGSGDIVISKYNPSGNSKLFSTYLGGSGVDIGINLIPKKGELCIFGFTESTDFPHHLNAFDSILGGTSDYFVTKLNTSGNLLLGSTYLGGSSAEPYNGFQSDTRETVWGEMIVDDSAYCYITGTSRSTNYPVTAGCANPYSDSTNFGDMVITKLNPGLNQAVWSTYWGGKKTDVATSLRINTNNELIVCGTSMSADFPVTSGVYQTALKGSSDIVLSSFNRFTGQSIRSSFLGYNSAETSNLLSLDQTNNIYLVGSTKTSSVVTSSPGAYNDNKGNVLFFKLTPDFSQLLVVSKFFEFVPSPVFHYNGIAIHAFNVDSCGNIYFAGYGSANLPVTPNRFQTFQGGTFDMYIGVFNPNYSSLKFASYFGSNGDEHLDFGISYFTNTGLLYTSICSDGKFTTTPNAYAPVSLVNTPIPSTQWHYYGTNGRYTDGFAIIDLQTFINANSTIGGTLKSCSPITATFIASTNLGTVSIDPGDGSGAVTSQSLTHTYSAFGNYTAYVIAGTDPNTCNQTDSIKILVNYGPPPYKALPDTTFSCVGSVNTLNAQNTPALYVWNTGETTQEIHPEQSGNYIVFIDNGYCSRYDSSYFKILPFKYPVILPNVITPNEDQVNDYWDFSQYGLTNFQFSVFNRWGQLLFETTDSSTKWNGTSKNGVPLKDGTYFWTIQYHDLCKPGNSLQQKGFIQIIH